MVYRVPQPPSVPVIANSGKQTAAAPLTDKGLGIFTHIGFAPRNSSVINFYVEGGLNYKGLIPTRDNDLLGVGFAYGHLNNNPQGDGSSNPGYEMVLETTYQIELTPWLSLQPDVQYVIHPSGTDIPNAFVLGARATVSF
jgi:porin